MPGMSERTTCRFCAEDIPADATWCPYCGESTKDASRVVPPKLPAAPTPTPSSPAPESPETYLAIGSIFWWVSAAIVWVLDELGADLTVTLAVGSLLGGLALVVVGIGIVAKGVQVGNRST